MLFYLKEPHLTRTVVRYYDKGYDKIKQKHVNSETSLRNRKQKQFSQKYN